MPIVLMGTIYIFFIPDEPLILKLVFKLIPMGLIVLFALQRMPKEKRALHWLILSGLLFCAVGDATLHWFIIGLSAFLIGHMFYMAAFFTQWQYSKFRFWLLIPLVVYGAAMGIRLVDALSDSENAALIGPVLFYLLAILGMAWSAIMSGNRNAIIGSLLFVASDSVLAWNMFIETVPQSHLLIMSTYYAAQFFIAYSIRGFVKNLRDM